PEPRWQRATRVVDSLLGEALGQLYVERHYPPEASRRMGLLVDDLREVFRERLRRLPWMTPSTREKALAKFERFRAKVGHPTRYRDYSSIRVDREDFLGNVLRASEFEVLRQTHRVGQPVDREEWGMTPPTVNAYFNPSENEIVFPAGILQPPFFDASMDDAVNYGGIGVVIGHEITHGYDDQGRRYDADGNLRDWWTEADAVEFKRRADGLVRLYSAQEALPGLPVNGELTLGENIADFGGVSLAFEALRRRLSVAPSRREPIDGLLPEQRFFVAYAQIWRQNIREPEVRRRAAIDPHALGRFRGSLPAIHHPEFARVFPRPAGSHPPAGSPEALW
ncbi:zinc metalloprotease, partial [mine drainage metagenome]